MEAEQKTAPDNAQRNGADAMRDAADQALKTSSTLIAGGLVKSATAGHMMAARLLYMIANDQVRMTAAEIKQARSLAAEWATEQKWLSDVRQKTAEIPDTGPKPED